MSRDRGPVARTIAFSSDGLAFHAECVAAEHARAVVVLCHGIPGSAPREPEDGGYAALARTVAHAGFAAVWFDFRGVRSSPGDFSIAGWVRDLGAALDALGRDRAAVALPRIVAGSSAGGAVAIACAAGRDDVAAVATLAAPATFRFAGDAESSLARLRNAGLIRDPNFPADPDAWWREADEWAAERHVGSLGARPLLIVHGDADDVAPYHHAERLFAKAKPPKELARIPGAGHQLRRDERGVACLLDWLDRLPLP